jgi:two-component system sensor histidine kinase UhpB
VLLRAVADPVLKNTQPGLFFFPVIYPIGRWLGIGPGVFALAVGLTACRYLFYTPRGQFFAPELRQQISILYYWLFGVLMLLAVHFRKKQVESLEHEIANRKPAESELRLGREEFRALAEKCPAGIFRTDATGACTYVNEYWCRLSGRSAADALGAGWGKAIHPDDLPHVVETWRAALAARRSYTVEYRVVLPDGRIRHAITTAQPVFDERGDFTHYIGTVLDITDLKQAYVSLEQKEKVLRNLIEAQEHEKQAIGHDIHDGLLQYAIGARMLLESLVRNHPEMPGADVIDSVDGYLAKGIEEGRQVVRGVRPTVLDDLGLEAALEDLAAQFEGLGVGVECRIKADLLAIPPSLQTTIYRVVQESLNNVRKHSGSDRATISLRQVDEGLRLEIEDRGHGFDVESARHRGFGMIGMIERVRLAGGTLRIDSAPGRGTRVTAELPLARAPDYKPAVEQPALT